MFDWMWNAIRARREAAAAAAGERAEAERRRRRKLEEEEAERLRLAEEEEAERARLVAVKARRAEQQRREMEFVDRTVAAGRASREAQEERDRSEVGAWDNLRARGAALQKARDAELAREAEEQGLKPPRAGEGMGQGM